MHEQISDVTPDLEEKIPDDAQLLDRDGNAVAGVGRLDQVIGAEAAEEFFAERDERIAHLTKRAIFRWAPGGPGYDTHRSHRRPRVR